VSTYSVGVMAVARRKRRRDGTEAQVVELALIPEHWAALEFWHERHGIGKRRLGRTISRLLAALLNRGPITQIRARPSTEERRT